LFKWDRRRLETEAAPWLEPDESIRSAAFAARAPLGFRAGGRVLVATDRHLYVFRRAFLPTRLLSGQDEKLDIQETRMTFSWPFLRVGRTRYGATSFLSGYDLRALAQFGQQRQAA
jgi:hypothetical protein